MVFTAMLPSSTCVQTIQRLASTYEQVIVIAVTILIHHARAANGIK